MFEQSWKFWGGERRVSLYIIQILSYCTESYKNTEKNMQTKVLSVTRKHERLISFNIHSVLTESETTNVQQLKK